MPVLIVAMKNEADAVLGQSELLEESTLFGRRVFHARAFGTAFSLVLSGIGKSNAAAAAMLAVGGLHADRLVNFGLAGGVSEKADIASVLRVTRAVQYDFDLSEVNGTPKGTLDEYASPYIPLADGKSAFTKATLATGDKLTGSLADIPLLRALGADVRDMEGGAIAHVAYSAGVPLYSYKAVSNKIGEKSVSEYKQFTEKALEALRGSMEKIFAEACK